MTILRYVSDLHLEFVESLDCLPKLTVLWNFDKNTDDWYLALLGDIGNPYHPLLEVFLEKVSVKYQKVFYIPGNHEYYNQNQLELHSVDEFNLKLFEMCEKFDNIILMNNKIFELNDFTIIGSILWSHIKEQNINNISQSINDYHSIKKNR